MTDFGLILTYILIIVAIIACIASPLLKLKNNPKNIRTMLVPIGALMIILIISMLISSSESQEKKKALRIKNKKKYFILKKILYKNNLFLFKN